MDEFFFRLDQISRLSDEEKQAIRSIITEQKLKKGAFWIEEGKRAHLLGFIKKGYLRKYYVSDGAEITDFFYLDNSFIGDIPAIVSKQPSVANAVAMEPTTILSIPYEKFDALCRQFPKIEHIMRVMIEQTFIVFYYRSVSFILSTPKKRYAKLMHEQPEVLRRAAQYHIASFLGITPQHLSRLRAEK